MRRHRVLICMAGIFICAYAKSAVETADTISRMLTDVEIQAGGVTRAATSSAPLRIASKEDLLRTGVTDVSDALHRMPGVTLRDYGGAGGLKTVSVRGFGAGHTGVVFDGVPLSDVQNGQIDLSRYSIDNVGSVSLVIGDNDDIFVPARMAASAATVSIVSEPPMNRPEVVAKFRGGSFGYVNPFLKVGMPVGERLSLGLAGEFIYADNDYPFELKNMGSTTTEYRNNSRMNSGHGELNMVYIPSDRTQWSAKGYYYENSRQLPGPVTIYNSVNHEQLLEQNAIAQAKVWHRVSEHISLKGMAKAGYSHYFYHDEAGKYPGGVYDEKYWQKEYYASGSVLCTAPNGIAADYSADLFRNNLNSNRPSDVRPFRNSLLQSATLKYSNQRVSVMARLLYSVYRNGAEISAHAARDAQKLSPSVSLSVKPWADELLFVRASYKNIFRMPTFNEAYFDHMGSTELLPESTNQLNVGLTYTAHASGWLPQAVFTVDGYVNNTLNMIVAVPYNMFMWNIKNLGKVRTYGLDATADLRFALSTEQVLSFTANYSLQRAMPMTDPHASDWKKQVAYIPVHSGSASVCYENRWANVSLHCTGVSERYSTHNNAPSTRMEGYVEFGATAWRTFALKGCSLDFRADAINLLDKQYSVVVRYPMPGRSYKFTVTLIY